MDLLRSLGGSSFAEDEANHSGRGGKTVIKMQADMWVMPVHVFVSLKEVRPHQELRREGKLVRWNNSMRTVIFLSHQWTAFDEPDHTREQLRTVQRMIHRMVSGTCPDTAPTFADAAIFSSSRLRITSSQWQDSVRDAFICASTRRASRVRRRIHRPRPHARARAPCAGLDYFSIPQIGSYFNGDVQSELVKAVNSIPAYIERSSHFFVVCPTVEHLNFPDELCNFGSWQARGWCRVEQCALLLARHNELPAIVITGGESAPFMISPATALANTPGTGQFSCCSRDHALQDADGNLVCVPCDKTKIGPICFEMLETKRRHALHSEGRAEYILWTAFMPKLLMGLPSDMPPQPDTIDGFLSAYRYTSATDEQNRGSGLAPLIAASLSGNAAVVERLVACEGVDVNARTAGFPQFFIPHGSTALHCAVGASPANHYAICAALLRSGANPNAPAAGGTTPLMGGFNSLQGTESLIMCAPKELNLEIGINLNNATALSMACFAGSPNVVAALASAGADFTHMNDAGSNKLTEAVQNEAADESTLELILERAAAQGAPININYQKATREIPSLHRSRRFLSFLAPGLTRGAPHRHGEVANHLRRVSRSCACRPLPQRPRIGRR